MALPSPPAAARTVWTLEPAAGRGGGGGGGGSDGVPRQRSAAPAGAHVHKYVAVERRRDARAALPAYECAECARFYSAMHAEPPAGGGCTHGAAKGVGRDQHRDVVGRHRAQWAPPLTPVGFWNIGFGDTPPPPPRAD